MTKRKSLRRAMRVAWLVHFDCRVDHSANCVQARARTSGTPVAPKVARKAPMDRSKGSTVSFWSMPRVIYADVCGIRAASL